MEIFANEFIMGDFNAKDNGLILSSFNYKGESEDDLGMSNPTIEQFISDNPVPAYLGMKYDKKLVLQLTFIKNPCVWNENMEFSEKDCRNILRGVTGIRGYQWTKIIGDKIDEDLWYRARVTNVSYKRINGHVTGILLDIECDSCFAYSKEIIVPITVQADTPFYIFNNTDDLNNYVLPIVKISNLSAGKLIITNITDNWTSEISNLSENEILTINSKRELLSSSIAHNNILNDFNLHWIRLLPEKNEYISNMDMKITFAYREPRKVGIT